MESLYSPMEKKAYLMALKRKFTSPLDLYSKRVTGFVLGPFFAVAHYQDYEWNRRITSECNRAYGFVKESHVELEIRYIRGWGLLCPSWVALIALACRGIFWFVEMGSGEKQGMIAWTSSLAIALLVCAVTAWHATLTDKGQAGSWEIVRLLENPEEYHI